MAKAKTNTKANMKTSTKKPYVPSAWSYIKPKEDDRRKLTLFVAGAVPSYLPERITKMTSNYDVVTVACAGSPEGEQPSEMEGLLKDWARRSRQNCIVIPHKDLDTFPGFMQFMGPDGNRAVLVYNDGVERDDMKFAKSLGENEDVQYRVVEIEPAKDEAEDFAKAVNNISSKDNGLQK